MIIIVGAYPRERLPASPAARHPLQVKWFSRGARVLIGSLNLDLLMRLESGF